MSEVRLEVVVTPRSATDDVRVEGAALRVRVTAPPADGRANAAVVRLGARALGVASRDVRIVVGTGGRRKVVAIAGLDAPGLAARLAVLAAEPDPARRR